MFRMEGFSLGPNWGKLSGRTFGKDLLQVSFTFKSNNLSSNPRIPGLLFLSDLCTFLYLTLCVMLADRGSRDDDAARRRKAKLELWRSMFRWPSAQSPRVGWLSSPGSRATDRGAASTKLSTIVPVDSVGDEPGAGRPDSSSPGAGSSAGSAWEFRLLLVVLLAGLALFWWRGMVERHWQYDLHRLRAYSGRPELGWADVCELEA